MSEPINLDYGYPGLPFEALVEEWYGPVTEVDIEKWLLAWLPELYPHEIDEESRRWALTLLIARNEPSFPVQRSRAIVTSYVVTAQLEKLCWERRAAFNKGKAWLRGDDLKNKNLKKYRGDVS